MGVGPKPLASGVSESVVRLPLLYRCPLRSDFVRPIRSICVGDAYNWISEILQQSAPAPRLRECVILRGDIRSSLRECGTIWTTERCYDSPVV